MQSISDTTVNDTSPNKRFTQVRVAIILSLIAEVWTYFNLTISRYVGQHLEPVFFRITTNSEIISAFLFGLICVLLFRSLIHPSNMSSMRSAILFVIALLSLWLSAGLAELDVAEFPREATIFFLFLRTLFLSLLIPLRRKSNSVVSTVVRIVRNSILVLGSAILITFIFTFTYGVSTDFKELKAYNADAAVILGAAVWHGNSLGNRPSPTLEARVKLGADFIKQKVVQNIVVTGSNAPNEQSEAEISIKHLEKLGVSNSVITSESNSRSTLEQVIYIREELRDKQRWKRFIIISDQYHLARVLEMCAFNEIDATGTPSRLNHDVTDILFYRLRESVALLSYWSIGK